MMVEYGVVIRRQFPHGELRWQFWIGTGMAKEHASFLTVMNHAGAMGFEAVAAGHFDELGVPEVLLQRRMETEAFAAAATEPDSRAADKAESKSAAKLQARPAAKAPAKKKAPAGKG